MSRYGIMKHFNDIGISQSRTHISIPKKTYLDKVFHNYDWNDITPMSLPINPSSEFFRALDLAELLEPNHRARIDITRFIYRAAIGELIWPLLITW
jgi:hypothetical protein